jgi:hypothetical protein
MAGQGGFDGLINKAIIKQIASCRPIPQSQVQVLSDTVPAL